MKKKEFIFGLNTSGFNTSTSVIENGKLLYAVEEERLNREKRTRKFPILGILDALKRLNLKISDIDSFSIGWNPAINLEAMNIPQNGQARFLGEIFYNVANPLINLSSPAGNISEQIIHLENKKKIHIFFVRHHLAHAASYYLSGFSKSAIVTLDAFGEKQCCHVAVGNKNKIETIWSQEFPHSLGSFYSAFTSFLGFKPQSDEWKLMGASAYGNPKRYLKKIEKIFTINEEGFEIDLSLFNHYQFHRPGLFLNKLSQLVGIMPNENGRPLNKNYYDLAASVQYVFEQICINLFQKINRKTRMQNLVFSGGCALNSVLNGKILQNSNFKKLFVPPFPDDSGVGVGSALYVYNHLRNHKKIFAFKNNYLGPSYSDKEINFILKSTKIKFKYSKDVSKHAANRLNEGKIIGWYQGNIEFGDRSLGNRSILADPRDPSMKDKVNKLIKYRESFRPFAPAILKNKVKSFFVNAQDTPFMEKVFLVKPKMQKIIPAVTHVDGSARLQTVTIEQNPKFYKLINNFFLITGVPIVLNTSFNLKGEPIVCSPQDAIKTFYSSGLDLLYLGNFFIEK